MAFEFGPIPASEQPDLIQFLVKSFRADSTLNSFRPDVIQWKYFSKHPEWEGPRSLAIKQKGQIVAHGGVWPVRLQMAGAEVKAIHLIDWAASRAAVGAGVHLLRKVAGLADVLLTIGGSEDTKSVLPKLGYKRRGELRLYARVVRPWLQFRTTPQKNWKTPVKFLRNSAHALTGFPTVPKGWQATKVSNFTGAIEDCAAPPRMTDFISSKRTAAGLSHLLRCPAAVFSGFQVWDSQRLRGYFVLAQIGRQVRIVDIQVNGGDQESWHAICALAARGAAADPDICEIVAASSIVPTGEAWLQAGFVQRRTEPIFCYDPRKLMSSAAGLNLSLADGDQCFLTDPLFPYLS